MNNEKALIKLINMYEELETNLLEIIIRHILKNDEFINSDYWRVEKLEELGLLNNEIVNYIAKVTRKTPVEIKKAFNEIGYNSYNENSLNKAYKGGILKVDPTVLVKNNVVQNLIEHSYKETTNRFLEISKKVEKGTREAYLNIVENTFLQTSSGVTYQEAIRQSLLELGDKGITTLTYKTVDENGNIVGIRNYDVEGTVRRELVSATNNLTIEINNKIAEELEAEYVYLSEHICCRPQHFEWQGTIIKRINIAKVTKLGEPDGMGGPNCHHYATAYFGDKRGNELKKISKEEATEKYNLSQKQRYLERGIRKWKRKERIFKSTDDKEYYEKCKAKVKEWQLRNKEFTEENNLRRDFSRENVEEVTKYNDSDIIAKNIKEEERKKVQYIGKIDKDKIGEYGNKIVTDNVVISEERILHIKDHHPELEAEEINQIKDILKDPDYVFKDRKNIDTVLYVKNIVKHDKNYRMVVKLNTNENAIDKANTIISMWSIGKKKLGQYIRNEEIVYEKLDKKE